MPRTGERGGPATRVRIADTAARLFLERGFDAVTVAEIAREAGVSSVTVFNHFPQKEDLFLDRAVEAVDLLRAAARDRGEGVDVLAALQDVCTRLAEAGDPLSGLDPRSVPFFRTVAGSPALIARARDIAAILQRALAEELAGDATVDGDLLAAFFIGGYASALTSTARARIAGATPEEAAPAHRERLARLFESLRRGVVPRSSVS